MKAEQIDTKYATCPTCGAKARIPDVPVRNTGLLSCSRDRKHAVPYTAKGRKLYLLRMVKK